MKIEELKKEIETENKIYRGICHDCGKHVEVIVTVNGGQIEISGGALYRVKQQYYEVERFFKCDVCFAEDPILRNWKKTEVYSRAIGYLRPVNQWNKGKKEEFKMRKEFANTKGM
jgi:ribonucleoside-triphosphate reductase